MKSEYKETPIGKIPEDWDVVRLGDIAEYIKGKKPEKMIEEVKEGYLSYLSTGYLRSDKKTKFAKISKNVILANENDLILLWDGSKAGEFFAGRKGILSSTMVKIQFRKKDFNQIFLFYSLKLMERYLSGQTKGTGIPHVDKNVLNNLKIPLPPLPEQKAIVSILSTVDNAIQKADESIAKTEKLKKGLMQELLTKGIGHKEFKDSKMGRIPKQWNVVKLMEIVPDDKPITYGIVQAGPNVLEGMPYIRSSDLNDDFIKVKNLLKTSKEIAKRYKRSEVTPGDIVFSLRGNLGETRIVPPELSIANLTQGTARISCRSGVDNEYVNFALHSPYVIRRITTVSKGSTFREITLKELGKLLITMPEPKEQQKIAEILSTVDNKLELQRKRKGKLERIKKGLMNDLLTGKKRVEVS